MSNRTLAPAGAPPGICLPPTWEWDRVGGLLRHIDHRSTTGEGRLLSITKRQGVVPRDQITDRPARAATLVGYKECLAGDLVVNQMSVFDGLLGVSRWDGLVTYHYLVFRPSSPVDTRFIRYVLTSEPWRQDFGCRVRGLGESTQKGVRTPHIRVGDFLQTAVPVPTLAEQRAIADYLGAETARIDALIAKKQQLIHLLEERWRVTIDAAIEDLPGPRVPLRRFVRLITQGASPQAGNAPYSAGERGLLKLSAVRFGEYRPTENKVLDSDFDFSRSLIPAAGDLLVTRANTPQLVGDACAVRRSDPNVVLCDLIYLLRLDERLASEFAAYVLIGQRSRREFSSLARGSSQSMVKLRGEDVVSARIPAVPRREQEAIVKRLDRKRERTTMATDALKRQIDLLVEHRQALITAAVTGEFAVPGAA